MVVIASRRLIGMPINESNPLITLLPRVEEQLNVFHGQQAGQKMAQLRGLAVAA